MRTKVIFPAIQKNASVASMRKNRMNDKETSFVRIIIIIIIIDIINVNFYTRLTEGYRVKKSDLSN